MQFLSIAFTQALLATAMAVPVANSLFSLTAVNKDLFPEGVALSAKSDGSIWIAAPTGETQLVAASVADNNLVHGVQVAADNSLISAVDGNDTLSLSNDAFLVENGINKATGCVAASGETQVFWGEATCAHKVELALRANPLRTDSMDLKNNFCFGGRKSQPCCAPAPCAPAPCAPAPVAPCAPPVVKPAPQPCTHEPECGCCTECLGCASECACGIVDKLCPKNWCICGGGPKCCCEPPAREPCVPAPPPPPKHTPAPRPRPAPVHPAPAPCQECGSSSCGGCGGGCPAEKCGSCLKSALDCLCPIKKLPCNKPCAPHCQQECCQPQPQCPPHVQPSHPVTVTAIVTKSAAPTVAPGQATTIVTPSPAATTTRFHTLTIATDALPASGPVVTKSA